MCLHTNAEYSTVVVDSILHCLGTHLQYEVHPGLKGLWIWFSVFINYFTLQRKVVKEEEREIG